MGVYGEEVVLVVLGGILNHDWKTSYSFDLIFLIKRIRNLFLVEVGSKLFESTPVVEHKTLVTQ